MRRPALAVARRSAAVLHSAREFALQDTPVLRLRMVEAVRAFRSGAIIADTRRRWAAAAWDAGVLIAVALVLFVVVNSFWKPFGVLTLTYYVGGILLLGNTPGVCLFASGPQEGDSGGPLATADLASLVRQVRDAIRRVIHRNG